MVTTPFTPLREARDRGDFSGTEVNKNSMGFYDAIKRWRLVQKGMSSGTKRRTQSDSGVVGAVDRSPWSRGGVYIGFSVLMLLLVLNSNASSPFGSDIVTAALFSVLFSVVGIIIFEVNNVERPKSRDVLLVFGGILLQMILIQVVSRIPEGEFFDSRYKLLLLPYCLAPMVHSVLLGRRSGVFSALLCAFLGALMVPNDKVMYYLIMALIVGLVSVLLTLNVRKRGSLLRAGFYSGLTVMIMGILFKYLSIVDINFTDFETLKDLGIRLVSAVLVSVLIAMIVSGILPMLESAFSLTTKISWLELSDLNHKLLKRLQLEAPGTFSHSLSVAALAESAAEAVGANALMCRVCAYYHDVGKLKKPDYFIENQGDVNPHDTITPTMSALVIIAHVKDGVDLALKYKLDPRIIKVIQEHHGDSLVYYFYRKAQEKMESGQKLSDQKLENPEDVGEVDKKNFRYPGPIPSFKESAIISLADAVESASRSLRKPTPSKISGLVNEIVRSRLADGQLDNCDLSMKDLTKIRESFSKTIRSMLHSRIDYPKDEEAKARKLGSKTEKLEPKDDKPATDKPKAKSA